MFDTHVAFRRACPRLLLLAAAGSVAAGGVTVLEGPTLTMNPNFTTPLAGVLDLQTDTAVLLRLTVTDGTDLWTVDFPDASQSHSLIVAGLKPGRNYTIDVDMTPGGFAGSVLTTTPSLPADFPQRLVTASDPASMEPGLTLIDCFTRGGGDSRPVYTMIVDDAGDVVWYSTICSTSTHRTAAGNLLYRAGANAFEIDLAGNTKLAVPLANPGSSLHHDFVRTSEGTYLSLTRQSVQVADFPTSETNPGAPTQTVTVADNPVVEFFPDGGLRNEWRMTDLLDSTRIAYDSLNPSAQGLDWVHANAVVYDPADDSVIASLRHQDAVVKFSRQNGGLIWILGPHDNWKPAFQPYLLQPMGAGFSWQYHQHAPMLTAGGNVMLFDNGNRRASPFDGNAAMSNSSNHSRGVEYEIDVQAMVARQVWEYGGNIPEPMYSGSRSDADRQPGTGNVLLTFSTVSWIDGVSSASLGFGGVHTRIVETQGDGSAQRVFEMVLYDAAGGEIKVYRSERIPGIYPAIWPKPPNTVGPSLVVSRAAQAVGLNWSASPVDAAHDAADYYVAYRSASRASGFSVAESTSQHQATFGSSDTPGGLEYFRIVAVNDAGNNPIAPAP